MIYSSKQGTFKWYWHLSTTLADLGFAHMEAIWEVFIANIAKHILILALHVDDCTITGDLPPLIKAFKEEIGLHFQITDLGLINWLLGMCYGQLLRQLYFLDMHIALLPFSLRTYLIYRGLLHLYPWSPFLFPCACSRRWPYPCSTPPLCFLSGVELLWLIVTMFTAYSFDLCGQPPLL